MQKCIDLLQVVGYAAHVLWRMVRMASLAGDLAYPFLCAKPATIHHFLAVTACLTASKV
jgi:hypothetical protein